jgi:hypothetical protein
MALASQRPDPDEQLSLRYWKAVANLPSHREDSLRRLEAIFADGAMPGDLDGPHVGRLLATPVQPVLAAPFEAATRLWMPWKGKVLSASSSSGRNLFTPGWRTAMKILWPRYEDVRAEPGGRFSTFAFDTWRGPSALDPSIEVFKIDYDHPGSPRLLIRPILDELVQIDDGLYLGQALMRWRLEYRRVAWFSLCA